jgi:hypothetical protein
MFTKTITYIDFNGTKRTEDHLFHISKAEAIELEMSEEGGLTSMIHKIINAQSEPKIFSLFKKFVLTAYGEKSSDGRRFIKVDANGHKLADDFVQSEAYNALMVELTSNAKNAADFFNNLVATTENKEATPEAGNTAPVQAFNPATN